MSRYPLEPDAAALDQWTAACVAFVREHVASLEQQPASDVDDTAELRRSFREPMPEDGRAIDTVLARLAPALAKSFNTAGPGYFGFIPGGGIYTAALADFIALATNRYVGVAKAAPVLAEIETQVVRWLASMVGFGPSAGGVLTSGGSIANLIAIVAARSARLGDRFHKGKIYTSRETHLSVAKAARVAGFSSESVRVLPVDTRFRIETTALRNAIASDLAAGNAPFLVVANAGSTNVGAIDPIPEIVTIARAHGMWVHADAAYGGFFRLVPEGAGRLRGLETCDSVTLDPHKGLFLPYGTGCVVVSDLAALQRANAGDAEYLRDVASDGDSVSFSELSPELSREFRGLRLWLPLQLHGLGAFRAQIAEKLALARLAYDRLCADARFEIVDEPQLSIVAFRLARGGDEANRELLARVNAKRRAFLSSTVLDGKLTLRLCVLSFRSHADRVEETVATLRAEAAALAP